MIRLFAALEAPLEIAEGLARRQNGLSGAAWRPADALHITLRFFGELGETEAEDLDLALAQIRRPPLELRLQGVGAFSEGERQTAVWAGLEPNPALAALAGKCESAAKRAGLKPDTRTYRPHVTLAYLRQTAKADVAAWISEHNLLKSPPWIAFRFCLFSSQLSRNGSRYTLQREYPFR